MRCHFAIPFIDKTVTDKSVARTSNIRKAFNSPFRPFLLSTTSIGQEGLDFIGMPERLFTGIYLRIRLIWSNAKAVLTAINAWLYAEM